MSLLSIQDAITAKLNELPQTVYENIIPEDKILEYNANGNLMPFIVAQYSGMVLDRLSRGIVGVRSDSGLSYVEVLCVGPSERSARQVAGLVRDKLTGYAPTGAGQLEPEASGKPYGVSDASNRPIKYVVSVPFIFSVNSVVS